MKITVNILIEWISEDDAEQKRTERILYISPDGEKIIVIDVSSKTALPIMRSRDELELAYEVADLRILEFDMYAYLPQPDEVIPEKYTIRRDRAWNLIESLVEDLGVGVYESSTRWEAIAQICKKTGKAKKVIYNYLRRYWQSGCNKNALLPKYKKCGNKGVKKVGKSSSELKLGRPSSLSAALGVKRGIRIMAHIEKLFEKGIKKFYLTRAKNSLNDAYRMMIDEFFNTGKELVNGVEIPILPDAEKLPSYNQFRYWYRAYYRDPVQEKKLRLGETKFNLLHRDLFGDSTSLSFGPGSVYMIDATIADVYLVSSFDRYRIIGRPVVYLIVDVFSRMIVGFSVALEGPSWLGAMLALDNMVTDKVAFCAEHGIKIEEWQWNCCSLPEAIFADRGEFEGYNADILVNILGCRIHNTSPYRGDLKAIVERQFGIAKEKYIKFIPGAVKERERGEKDHRLDATLTLHEFRALMITNILDYNLNHKLTWYRPDEFLVADNVPLKPIALWNWGIQNRSGILRSMPRDAIRFSLMPRKEVTVTRYGIHFQKDVYYLPPSSINQRGKSAKVTVAFDPRSMDYVYLPSDTADKALACPLTPASQLYLGRDLHEAEQLFATRLQQDELDVTRQNQTGAACRAQNQKIIKDALKAKRDQSSGDNQSDASKLRNIRDNRTEERDYERNNTAWSLGGAPPVKQLPPAENSPHFSETNDNEQDYISAPDYLDLIEEVLENGQGE
jgi:putative transposase